MKEVMTSRILRIIPLLIAVCFFGLPAYGKYGGGTGEPNDPYLIATAEDLILLAAIHEDYDKHFILTANIDLDPNLPGRKVFDKAVIGFNYETPFTGTFDGNGHTISHLTIEGENYLGLFGRLRSSGKVRNLGVVDTDITGSYFIGGLVGDNSGTITNCYFTGSVSGISFIGGLVGENHWLFGLGIISDCYSTGSVSGTKTVGGLVGCNWSVITNSYAASEVSGNEQVGGLVGSTSYGIISTIDDCYFLAPSDGGGPDNGHGLPLTDEQMKQQTSFIDWDFVGKPDGPHDIWAEPVGGGYPILWWQLSPLSELPFLSGKGEPNDPYLISTADELNSVGHNPRLMAAHFKLINDINLTDISFFIIGSKIFPFTGVFDGNGHTISNFSYTSTNRDNIGLFRYVENGTIKNLGLIDPNIDTGTGRVIGSLAGYYEGGIISNCYVEDGIITGFSTIGGLVGWIDGSIINCHSSTSVSGIGTGFDAGDVGGLVGLCGGLVGNNKYTGTISDCYSTGSVSGYRPVGGLIGTNLYGHIVNCYAAGSVAGNEYVGGLVGLNRNIINNCYSVGHVSGIEVVGGLVGDNGHGEVMDSLWDIQTSGQVTSDGGTGKTTAEMQTAGTFIGEGWDFVDETTNGTEDIWWIDEGNDYPRLWWELLNDESSDIDIVISNPIPDERFVRGEEISFSVTVSSQLDLDGFQLEWTSDKDGDLGTGLELNLDSLSTGSHLIEVCGYGIFASIPVRIYDDLWELYQAPPAEGEMARILNDFSFNLIDGEESDEKWDAYPPVFDQNSTDPSFLVAISKIDVLRHQRFSTPVPFTNGQTLYDHFRTYVKTINLKLDCSYNSAGGDRVNLNRNFSVWDERMSGTPSNPDACKIPFANHSLSHYTKPLYLLLHEGRHCEPSDPGHRICDGRPKDEMLENGSGYAQAALYLMWVYKYGLNDPPFIRSEAGSTAAMFLNDLLCTAPTHSDPNVQTIIDELLN